jgi:hypothetical protein
LRISALTSPDPRVAAAGSTTTPSLTGSGATDGVEVSLGPRVAGGVAVDSEAADFTAAALAAGAGRAAGLAAGGTRLTVARAGSAAALLAAGFDAPLVAAPTGVVRARVTFGLVVGGVRSLV